MEYAIYTAFIEERPLSMDYNTFARLIAQEMLDSSCSESKALESAAAWYDTAEEYFLPKRADLATFAASHRHLCVAVVLDRRAQLPEEISIHGCRWFQKSAGNTYFSAYVCVNGETVEEIDYEYGYGDQYEHSIWKRLADNHPELIQPKRHEHGGIERPSMYCRRKGITYRVHVSDVSRKRDL